MPSYQSWYYSCPSYVLVAHRIQVLLKSALAIIMNLNQIAHRHRDNRTDQLYEPLRKAIHTFNAPTTPSTHQLLPFRSDLKSSSMNFTPVHPKLIQQNTLVPQNMRLVQTNNPLKRFKARSRGYRAISVEERVGSPINNMLIKQEMMPRGGTKKQIVYDYEPGEYDYKTQKLIGPAIAQNAQYRLPVRTRSATFVGLARERVQSKTVMFDSKLQNMQSSNPSTKASMQLGQQAQNQKARQEKKLANQVSNSQTFSDYYQDCKRYKFDKKVKAAAKGEKGESGERVQGTQFSGRNNSYKYNLFSMFDEQANTNCASCCTKNEVVSPRIKQRW